MSTALKCPIKSTSSATTEQIAATIGSQLRGGEVIELVSDLGGGKTVFAKGLAQGAGSPDEVTSPTFTISKIYHCPKFDIHHFDFYRLSDPGIVSLEIKEVIGDPKIVTIIEWANVIKAVLPKGRVKVTIKNQDGTNRLIKIDYPKKLAYLMQEVKC
jgi:tRNA threonylcarbamoyladenosine biosynthesis protein TsaE